MFRRVLRPGAIAAAVLLLCASADAAITRVAGPTTLVGEPKGFFKFDAAHDSHNRVYLTVWGTQFAGPVNGMLLNESGVPISGVFAVSDGVQQSGWARVIYSAEQRKFLVSYVRIVAPQHHQKVARFVTIANNTPSLGPEMILDDWAGDSGTATGMAYSAPAGKFLVTWSHYATGASGMYVSNSFVTTINGAGNVSQTHMVSDSFDGESDPEIACDPVSRKCLVIGSAWGIGTGGKSSFWARYIDDATGAPFGTSVTYVAVWGGLMDPPAVAHSPVSSQFLMGIGMGGAIHGILGNGSSGSLGTAFPILQDATGTNGAGYGFLSMKYNAGSQTILASMTTWVGYPALQEFDGWGVKLGGGFDLIPDTPERTGGNDIYSTANQFSIVAPNSVTAGAVLLDNHFFSAMRSSVYTGNGGTPPPPAQLTVAPLTLTPSSGHVGGNPITLTASATGGAGPYTYQFLLWNGSSWSVAQSYSTSSTFTMSPAAGTYAVQVWVRNAGSTAPYDAWTGTQPFVVSPPRATLTGFTVNRTFPSPLNVPITWTASAVGGPVEYKFLYTFNGGATWVVGQNYGPSNSFTWYPPLGSNNAVQVWVRRVGSATDPEDWRSTGLFLIRSTGAVMDSVTPRQGGPTPPTTTLSWSAVGFGGSGPLEYKFFLYNQGTGAWSVLQDWGTSAQAYWTPGMTGLFLVQTWVRTVGSGVNYEDWRNSDYFAVTNSTALSLTADRSLTSLRHGDLVTWTAQVAGPGLWEYQFITFNGSTWTRQLPAYKADNTFSWFVSAGARALQVWVRPAGSGAAWERWTSTGIFVVNP